MALSMEKRTEKVKLIMAKRGVPDNLKAQVEFELDVSGSTEWLYKNGTMQELTERLLAVALRIDADGKLPITSFSDRAHKHGEITVSSIDGYINREFLPECRKAGNWCGGTNYETALLKTVTQKRGSKLRRMFSAFVKQEPVYPVVHLFVTDGDDSGNTDNFNKLIDESAETDYFILVGVGKGCADNFAKLRYAADTYSNCGFAHFPHLPATTDDEMYEALLAQEACDWLKARQPK